MSLLAQLATIDDPRRDINKRHDLRISLNPATRFT